MPIYSKGLNREIARRIISQGQPTTVANWMMKAAEMDSYEQQARQLLGSTSGSGHKGKQQGNKWCPTYVPRMEYRGEPMEIDQLCPKEEQRRKKEDQCYNCGKKEHFAQDC